MKKSTTMLAVALLITTAFTGTAFAQAPASTPAAATTPAAAPDSKDAGQPVGQLSPEKAKIYSDAMQPALDANKELKPQIRKLYHEVDAILTAEKFDKAAYLAKTAELDQIYAKSRERINEAFVSVVEKFSQEDRKLLVKERNQRHQKP